MKQKNQLFFILLSVLTLVIGLPMKSFGKDPFPDAFEINRQLGRGINLGNMLEAPNEGEWGVRLEESYFKLIHDAGFDSVRIPIRWSAHADTTAPYIIDSTFMNRVEWAVNQAITNHLPVIINFHHYAEMNQDPEKEMPRFLGLWEQVANHFKNSPETVIFEIDNEPFNKLKGDIWNETISKTIKIIRKSNPERIIMVGPDHGNTINNLFHMQLPEDDRRLIVTFHYYSPIQFTHQSASWVNGSEKWAGTKWRGTPQEKQDIINDFNIAKAWQKKYDRPIYLGEFGAFSAADMTSRVRWTRFMVRQAEKRNFSWGYWEFCSSFGIYDPEKNEWRKPLLKALHVTKP